MSGKLSGSGGGKSTTHPRRSRSPSPIALQAQQWLETLQANQTPREVFMIPRSVLDELSLPNVRVLPTTDGFQALRLDGPNGEKELYIHMDELIRVIFAKPKDITAVLKKYDVSMQRWQLGDDGPSEAEVTMMSPKIPIINYVGKFSPRFFNREGFTRFLDVICFQWCKEEPKHYSWGLNAKPIIKALYGEKWRRTLTPTKRESRSRPTCSTTPTPEQTPPSRGRGRTRSSALDLSPALSTPSPRRRKSESPASNLSDRLQQAAAAEDDDLDQLMADESSTPTPQLTAARSRETTPSITPRNLPPDTHPSKASPPPPSYSETVPKSVDSTVTTNHSTSAAASYHLPPHLPPPHTKLRDLGGINPELSPYLLPRPILNLTPQQVQPNLKLAQLLRAHRDRLHRLLGEETSSVPPMANSSTASTSSVNPLKRPRDSVKTESEVTQSDDTTSPTSSAAKRPRRAVTLQHPPPSVTLIRRTRVTIDDTRPLYAQCMVSGRTSVPIAPTEFRLHFELEPTLVATNPITTNEAEEKSGTPIALEN